VRFGRKETLMRRLLMIAALLLALGGCDGGDDGNSGGNPAGPSPGGGTGSPTNGTMTARIDGGAWTATAVVGGGYSGGLLTVVGGDTASQTIGFALLASGPGTYSTTQPNGLNFSLTIPSAGQSVAPLWVSLITQAGSSGTVTITSLSATGASGTFSFVATAVPGTPATGSKNVTEGAFNVRF
jgi:hypothetical protein